MILLEILAKSKADVNFPKRSTNFAQGRTLKEKTILTFLKKILQADDFERTRFYVVEINSNDKSVKFTEKMDEKNGHPVECTRARFLAETSSTFCFVSLLEILSSFLK